MNEFEFEGKKWEFMGWKDEQSFIARPGTNGKPRIITPVPALPEGAQWIAGKIIPNAVPVRVNRAYLLPPPCFDSEETAQGAAAVSSSILKAFNGTTYKQPEALFLSPGDNEELQKMLDAWKVEKKKEYDAARKEAKGIKDQTNRKTRIEAIKRQYEEPAYTFNGVECAGALNTTLNMVRAGAGDLPGPLGRRCLRDALLVDRWADSKGLDLYEMAANRKRFLTWLGKQASHNLPWSDDSPEFLNLCEFVRWRIEFEGGAEVWLSDCWNTPEPKRTSVPHAEVEMEFLEKGAAMQRLSSSGIIVNGEGSDELTEDEKLFLNKLKQPNPKREGWALSYAEIARHLGLNNATAVQRKREDFEGLHPNFSPIISEARQMNDKRNIHPDTCGTGKRIPNRKSNYDND